MKELGKEKVERVAVLISSPDLSESQLLGILIVKDGTVESLGKAIKKLYKTGSYFTMLIVCLLTPQLQILVG